MLLISSRITTAWAQDFDDFGEIVHLTPKKEEALNTPEIFSLKQFLQFLKDAAGIQNNHIVQVVINSPS